MGYDEKRLRNKLNRLDRCGLCKQLCDLDLIVESKCLHLFCRRCLQNYLVDCGHHGGLQNADTYANSANPVKCPISGKVLKLTHLRKGILDELASWSIRNYKITCEYESRGCSAIIPVGKLSMHSLSCSYRGSSSSENDRIRSSHSTQQECSTRTSNNSANRSVQTFYVNLQPSNGEQGQCQRITQTTNSSSSAPVTTHSQPISAPTPSSRPSIQRPSNQLMDDLMIADVETRRTASQSISESSSSSSNNQGSRNSDQSVGEVRIMQPSTDQRMTVQYNSINRSNRRAMSIESLLFDSLDRETSSSSLTPAQSTSTARVVRSHFANLSLISSEPEIRRLDMQKGKEKSFPDFRELDESLQTLRQTIDQLCQKPLLKQQEELIELKIKLSTCMAQISN